MRISTRKERTRAIFTILAEDNPQPTTELNYSSGFELLVAVILSAQATDVGVNKATARLFPIANTAERIALLGEEGLIPYIKTIGLYRNKAKNVAAMAKIVAEKYEGKVPQTHEELESLPGVGRKTANVILNTLFGKPTIAVDTHVFRLSNRLGIATGKDVLTVEKKLLAIIPQEFLVNAHHWLILHGRYICRARVPECAKCKLTKYCDYYSQNCS